MLSCGINVTMWGSNVIMCDQCYHVGVDCYHVGSMLSCGISVIMWDQGYHVGPNVIMCDKMLSYGMNCYHVGWNVGSNVIMFSYHVMLSCDVIMGHDNTPPFYFS